MEFYWGGKTGFNLKIDGEGYVSSVSDDSSLL